MVENSDQGYLFFLFFRVFCAVKDLKYEVLFHVFNWLEHWYYFLKKAMQFNNDFSYNKH